MANDQSFTHTHYFLDFHTHIYIYIYTNLLFSFQQWVIKKVVFSKRKRDFKKLY